MSPRAERKPGRHLELYAIAVEMGRQGLPEPFITAAVDTAVAFEGVYDLMILWQEEDDPHERDLIVADLQDLIDDCRQETRETRPSIRFDDLEAIAANVRAFKDSLRLIVDEHGGIKELSRRTGMPQPSLSRFFSSSSMPRRSTLLKIARALDLGEVELDARWVG